MSARAFCHFVFAAVSLVGLWAADPVDKTRASFAAKRPNPHVDLSIDSTLVLINVTVVDRRNRPFIGLEKDHFRLFEDKVEQKITHISLEDTPVSVGLVFDSSGSMARRMNHAREAVAEFLDLTRPEDEFFVVEFNERPFRTLPFTRDAGLVQNRLMNAKARGKTALLDAIYLAAHEMKNARNARRMLLLLSDGADNGSRYTESEIKNIVREADVSVYSIGLKDSTPSGAFPDGFWGSDLLEDIAEQSGGRYFAVDNIKEMPEVAAKIGEEIRSQYVLGYSPTNREHDGKYRRVQLRLAAPPGMGNLRAYWRQGYYAPSR
jgi:VWFA-related protein